MSTIICAVLHVILSIFIPSANLLIIIIIRRLKKRSSRNYVFILNLAAADLLVGVMCIVDALDDATDALFDTNLVFCLIRICMGITPCIGSILTLLLVSLDKYLAVKLPLHYPSLMSKKRVILSLVVLWVLSFLVGHLPLISSGLRQNKLKGNCGLLSAAKSDYLYIICFGIFTPALLILVFLHISVGRIAYRQHKQIQRSCLHADIPSVHLCYVKALRTTLIVVVCFIVFWGPYYGTAIVKATFNKGVLGIFCKSGHESEYLLDGLISDSGNNKSFFPSSFYKTLMCNLKTWQWLVESNSIQIVTKCKPVASASSSSAQPLFYLLSCLKTCGEIKADEL
ncbi:PREDICTED: glucose-dependent insulinotropic receptor-like [Thamnophis sirtalis]|uniref:Glucose-dependent insulinotropic receptor-like n=1 Tax=Thamnophis sirtalis TaxID=35019 RepID=A0A6I9YUG9_9SAUR|nr:PREDICTED: glucose-dependent insulinotropic receptor-like [Thamnophis sirtalis]